MHLLYLDDAGSASNKNEEYLVLGGVSVFEAQADFITRELDKLAQSIEPGAPASIEFHASEIFSRRKAPWSKMSKQEAQGVIKAVLQVLAKSYDTARAFACAIRKDSYLASDPLELAFEDLCNRFDRYLARLRAEGDRQRGLLILDESSHETTLQGMARDFRTLGSKWGVDQEPGRHAVLCQLSRVSIGSACRPCGIRGVSALQRERHALFRRHRCQVRRG